VDGLILSPTTTQDLVCLQSHTFGFLKKKEIRILCYDVISKKPLLASSIYATYILGHELHGKRGEGWEGNSKKLGGSDRNSP
jgi:hypothetical protein